MIVCMFWRIVPLLLSITLAFFASTARADQEASNVAGVFTGPYGRCYAKSVPDHIYDPYDAPRQQGRTLIYQVGQENDELIGDYNWYSWKIYLLCSPGSATVIRLGPWQRGHNPRADHLAIAFYRDGKLIKRYSTLNISGPEKALAGSFSEYRNVSASVSHYAVFAEPPELTKILHQDGAVFSDNWNVTANTVDGRQLVFDSVSGDLQ